MENKWRRLREATAAADAPALLRSQNDGPDVEPDGDADDINQTCPTCSGTGIKGDSICSTCDGAGMMVKEATVCSICFTEECDVEGMERIREAALTAAARKAIPKSKFAIPSKAPGPGSYPIHDRAHAVAALARASGKPEEGTVKSAVDKAYPDLRDKAKEAEPFGGKKAPPFGKDKEDDTKDGKGKDSKDSKDKDSKPPWLDKAKEGATLEERIGVLEQSVDVFRQLREAKPASMTATFSQPVRVRASNGQEGYSVTLIREGRGNSEDDQYYSADAIRELCESGVCEGMQAYGNHPNLEEEENRPERDVKELVGVYHDVKLAESGSKVRADAVFVPLTLDEHHPRYGWVVTLAEAAARSTAQQPLCGISLYGLSAGDDTDRPDGTFGRMVSMIRPTSGDIVTNAGAGGGFIRQLMESARARRNRSREEQNPMKLMEYQRSYRDAAQRVREAATDEDRTTALEALAALENESIDRAPDTIEALREAAPALVQEIADQAKADESKTIEELREDNKKLRNSLGGINDAISVSEALREAGITDSKEMRRFARIARTEGLTSAEDIKEMVEAEKSHDDHLVAQMRESLDLSDLDVVGAIGRTPAFQQPSDGGLEAMREVGVPLKDAE